LGAEAEKKTFIETKPRYGCRFVMPVEDARRKNLSRDSTECFDADQEFVKAKAALETMDRDAVEKTRQLFADILSAEPDNVSAKIGLGAAGFLIFESTRVDRNPATGILVEAERHAHEACDLDRTSAEAWRARSRSSGTVAATR
jgi:hypothetical protein